jgi:hypothetical protein
MGMLPKDEFDKIFLNELLKDRGNQAKLLFLGFLTTINIAFYAGFFKLNNNNILINFDHGLPILILILLTIINYLFTSAHSRESKLDKIITNRIKIEYIEQHISKELKDQYHKLENDDTLNLGKEGKSIKILLSLINAIPLSLIALPIICANTISLIAATLIFWVFYYFFFDDILSRLIPANKRK